MRKGALWTCCMVLTITCFGQVNLKPANNDTLNFTDCHFSIPQNQRAAIYKIEVSSNETEFEKYVVFEGRSKERNIIVDSGLTFDQEYFWRYSYFTDNKQKIYTSPVSSFYILGHVPSVTQHYRNTTVGSKANLGGYIILDNGIIINRNGKVVWTMPYGANYSSIRNLQLCHDGNLTFTDGKLAYEIDLKGNILWQSPLEVNGISLKGYHHDFRKLPNGNYLCIAEKSTAKDIVYNVVFEITQKNKAIWLWDEEVAYKDDSLFKGSHINSAALDKEGKFLYISNRDLQSIAKINTRNGAIEYSIGYRYMGGVPFFENNFFNGQHALSILSNGNLMLFNNNTSQVRNNGASSVLILSQPANNIPPEIIWEYVFDFGSARANFSGKLGDADELSNGNILVYAGNSGRAFEVTKNKEIVWECLSAEYDPEQQQFFPIIGYRAEYTGSLFPHLTK